MKQRQCGHKYKVGDVLIVPKKFSKDYGEEVEILEITRVSLTEWDISELTLRCLWSEVLVRDKSR